MRIRTPKSLAARAVDCLSRREYSRKDLRIKLARTLGEEADFGEIDAVLDDLEARGYLSEKRFAESLVRSKAARFGDARLARDMRRAGLDAETIGKALETAEATEADRLRALWLKKFGRPPRDHREKASQVRFLVARGFPLSCILRVIPALDDDGAS